MVLISKSALGTRQDGFSQEPVANSLGIQVVMDFYTYMSQMGCAYQLTAGSLTTPLVGDVVITTLVAEYSVDALSGTTIIPTYQNISIRLGTGTLHEYATKSVPSVSTAGAAFVPLPLTPGGVAAVSTARVAAAGGVTVTVEATTTTRRHWSWSNPAAAATGALPTAGYALDWNPRALATPLWLKGPVCLYTQIGAAGTGPSYYALLDWLEAPTAVLF